jgi:hypothetical protein
MFASSRPIAKALSLVWPWRRQARLVVQNLDYPYKIMLTIPAQLFDQQAGQGKVSSGASKESAVMQAGEMALKFYMKSQGGSSSSSGLLGLASKFL